ncbi:alpha/beta hydrolase family protein [Chloroflexota bacterium]
MFKSKSLEQIKADIIERVGLQRHPMKGTLEADVRRGCDMLQSLESDHWCGIWSEIASPYEEKGQEQEKAGNNSEAERNYLLAFNYYRVARFAVPNTPDKKVAYHSSVVNYVKASRYFDPPLEKIVIPFAGKEGEGKEIPAYIRKPKGIDCPPVLIAHGGVDVFKEEEMVQNPAFFERGFAILAMDMPGTGECPILGTTDAERLYDTVITYIQNRDDLDGTRIALMGLSFGGYWATRMAHAEPKRLTAAVDWGGGTHYAFQPDWQAKCRYAPSHLGNDDLIVTRAHAFGIYDFDEWVEFIPGLSLLTRGILDKPCAPLLIVNGKDDLHYPIEDIYILLEHGSSKTVRLFPGGHMGITPQTLPTVADWLARQFHAGKS